MSPSVVVFDVNETLSDMAALAPGFAEIGAPEQLGKLWFATVLRDGFALTAAGSMEQFSRIGQGSLRQLLGDVALNRDLDAAVEHIMAAFMARPLHPDVADGVRALRRAGLRLVTLSNGSAQVAEELLRAAGVRDQFEALLSVEGAGMWKPARVAYEHAGHACGTVLADMLLVAAHPWDIDGASRAGMSTAWVNRSGSSYPDYFAAPTHAVSSLLDLPAALA